MPRSCLQGWFKAIKWIVKKPGNIKVFKLRFRMWIRLLKKKYFWLTEDDKRTFASLGIKFHPKTIEWWENYK